jgi:formylglycine-generating enzyme required for sulfatase activity
VQRFSADLMVSPDWRPYARTLQAGVFASRFPGKGRTVWTLINRQEHAIEGEQLAAPHQAGTRYFDVWNGVALDPRIAGDRAVLSMPIAGKGFGAILALAEGETIEGLDAFLADMRARAATPLASLSADWTSARQELVPTAATRPHAQAPEGMAPIPAGEFDFVVHGVEIEGYAAAGVDVQYPWEDSPRRHHRRHMAIDAFWIDRFPVTNARFKAFLDASGYAPADDRNFLNHWHDGAPPPGWENKPVTWVSLDDARAYAAWAGKRLPREWEWHYAAQGTDGRVFPWGDVWDVAAAPEPSLGRTMPVPADVDAHPAGASPFGVMDLVGNIWQWTDEYRDDRIRAAVLRGGSAYQPQASHWYFPQAYRLDEHGKFLLMAPAKDRSAGIGFRCAADR